MRGLIAIVVALVATMVFNGCSTVQSYDDLSAVQISALQESDQRLDVFDQRLKELDDKLAKGKIHIAAYKRQADALTSLIAEESQFQNAILTRDPKINEMADHLLNNIGKVVEIAFALAPRLAIAVLSGLEGSHGTISN